MEGISQAECHLSSAAAFVEGGTQDACDYECSICLEAFCEVDPSSVTSCKHEFHLHCVLEWCHRSSQCPMCWQIFSLKDPTSQELLAAVDQERRLRIDNANYARNTNIFLHPALSDIEMQHVGTPLSVGESDAEFEERIIRQLAATGAMRRVHHVSRREERDRTGLDDRSQNENSNLPYMSSLRNFSVSRGGENALAPRVVGSNPSTLVTAPGGGSAEATNMIPAQVSQIAQLTSGISSSTVRMHVGQSSPVSQDGLGLSDLQALSESLKSQLSAVSMRYKESMAKSTRGWSERLFPRNSSVADIGFEVRREVNAGISTVSRMMERLDTRQSRDAVAASASSGSEVHAVAEPSNEGVIDNYGNPCANNRTSSSCGESSGPN